MVKTSAGVVTVPMSQLEELELLPVSEPELPACSKFEGAGGRCSSCKTRKPLHA